MCIIFPSKDNHFLCIYLLFSLCQVILGGGLQPLGAQSVGPTHSPNSTSSSCKRQDGRNLVQEWKQMRDVEGVSYAFASDTQELSDVDVDSTEYIMGMF